MARKLSKILVSQTEADLIKNKAAQQDAMGFATDEDSLVFNQHVIRGVSDWGRQKLKAMEDAEVLSKLTAQLSYSPATGSVLKGGAALLTTITVKVTWRGKAVAAEVSPVGSDFTDMTFTAVAGQTGTYTGKWNIPAKFTTGAVPDGMASISEQLTVKITVPADDKDYAGQVLTKTVSFTYVQYAPIEIVCTTDTTVPTAAYVGGGTKLASKGSVAGKYTIPTVANRYVWICVPNFLSITSVTAGPIPVPGAWENKAANPVATVTGVQIGDVKGITYKCYRADLAVAGTSVEWTIA